MEECKTCIDGSRQVFVNYGELTSLGGEIKVPDCYAEHYDEDSDSCKCANYLYKGGEKDMNGDTCLTPTPTRKAGDIEIEINSIESAINSLHDAINGIENGFSSVMSPAHPVCESDKQQESSVPMANRLRESKSRIYAATERLRSMEDRSGL